jgi:hypothetical protein
LLPVCLFAVALFSTADLKADHAVPFKGFWTGVTTSAVILDPSQPVVTIVSDGGGQLTHLGAYMMSSPHTSNIVTGFTEGEQIFTSANGDTLTAYCEGTPVFDFATGIVVGTLDCEFTSGTGRFEGVTGSYEFSIVSTLLPEPLPNGLPGFATEATITGEISY